MLNINNSTAFHQWDVDYDGIADIETADFDNDGTIDTVNFSDSDYDGVADVGLDTNYDGFADVAFADTNYDGVIDTILDDVDYDGIADFAYTDLFGGIGDTITDLFNGLWV